MRYTVIWSRAAQDQLADLWLRAADRVAVTRASDRIDRTLATDPETKGVPYFGDRVFHAPPLHVAFVVRPDDRIAEVIEVW